VPEFAKLFDNLGAKLPTITVFMLTVGIAAQSTRCSFCLAWWPRDPDLEMEEHGSWRRAD